MKKVILSTFMAAVISMSAVAASSTVVGAVSSNLATPKITKAESINGGVKISWNKSNGAEKYRVYYKGSKGWTRLTDTTSTSYTDSKVSSGKTYTYTVRCINSSATKFTSGYDSKGKTVKYISAPKITKAESVNGGAKISWNKSNGAEKYRVYYKGSKGWTRLADTTSTSYTDKAVSSGKSYTYTVRCISADAKRFTSGYNGTGKSIKYVSAPKISKTEATYNSVTLNWDKVNGAEKYRVYRKGEKGWSRLFDTTSTTFTDTNLYAETAYTYTVRCINSSANKFTSGYNSKGFTVTTLSAPAEHTHSWKDITKATQVKVVDQKAYTYEEPVYEKQGRTICKVCGADITDNCTAHNKQHALNGEPVSYHDVWVEVQVGTKTVTVPEKSHYETKTKVVGRKCSGCGKVEMFSEEHTHTWQNVTKETKVKVVDKEAYTYEEPIYEKHDRTICNRCGADITDNLEHIFECNSNYHNEWRDIQVGTKTVTVPEKSHYETKTEVVGRKCSGCGKVEYY